MTSEPDFPALPVVFDPKILVQNPMFAELLQQLETKLTPTGVSLDVENAYQTARLNLEREKGPICPQFAALLRTEGIDLELET
jgi:hypothetical protein